MPFSMRRFNISQNNVALFWRWS